MNRNKYNNKTFSRNENNKNKRKVVDSMDINRNLIIGFSNCGKTSLMDHIRLQKQEPFLMKTKSLNQYPNIKAKTSDEIQPLNEYENSTVVFDDMLPSKRESNNILFFTRGRHNIIDIH